MARLLRLVAIIAVLLMPLGMAEPARAHSLTDMSMAHCPDQDMHHAQKGTPAECTMACAAALPAMDLANGEAPLVDRIVLLPAAASPLHGLHPDTATPPPKTS